MLGCSGAAPPPVLSSNGTSEFCLEWPILGGLLTSEFRLFLDLSCRDDPFTSNEADPVDPCLVCPLPNRGTSDPCRTCPGLPLQELSELCRECPRANINDTSDPCRVCPRELSEFCLEWPLVNSNGTSELFLECVFWLVMEPSELCRECPRPSKMDTSELCREWRPRREAGIVVSSTSWSLMRMEDWSGTSPSAKALWTPARSLSLALSTAEDREMTQIRNLYTVKTFIFIFLQNAHKRCFADMITYTSWDYIQTMFVNRPLKYASKCHILGVVSLTFRELSKIISRKYTMPVIIFMVTISSWKFVRVPKAWLWAHEQIFSLKCS